MACCLPWQWTFLRAVSSSIKDGTKPNEARSHQQPKEEIMLRGALLWLIGIPVPVIIILWLLGYLH
jgi:hypothetical protein